MSLSDDFVSEHLVLLGVGLLHSNLGAVASESVMDVELHDVEYT